MTRSLPFSSRFDSSSTKSTTTQKSLGRIAENGPYLATLLFILGGIVRIAFHLLSTPVAWDASVYIGMAKAIATLGAGGLWEPLRPLVWPLMLSPFALLKLDLVVAGTVVQFLIGMGVLWLTYVIAREAFGERAALWALGFVAFAPVLAFYEHQLLTEQPAVFFALLAIWLLARGRLFLSGMSAALAFLTKFPEGLITLAIAGALVFGSRDMREFVDDALLAFAGFMVPVFFFMIANWILYRNPLAAVVAASDVIATSGLWLYAEGPLFYFRTLLEHNILLVFALPGAVLALRKNRATLGVLFAALVILAYLLHLPHKEVRFLPLVFPFVAILAGAGWNLLQVRLKGASRHVFICIVLILVGIAAAQAVRWGVYFSVYEGPKNERVWSELYPNAASGTPLIVTSDPRLTLFTDEKLVPLYYPLFPENLTEGLNTLVGAHTLYFSPCDTPCAPDDAPCKNNLQQFGRFVNATWTLREMIPGECPIMLYARP
jgi:hypothetical protein